MKDGESSLHRGSKISDLLPNLTSHKIKNSKDYMIVLSDHIDELIGTTCDYLDEKT